MMRRSSDRAALLAALALSVIMVFGAAYFLTRASARTYAEKLRSHDVEACERVNILREESNERADVIREFILEAAETRAESGDEAVARRYRRFAGQINTVPVYACDEVVPTVGRTQFARY